MHLLGSFFHPCTLTLSAYAPEGGLCVYWPQRMMSFSWCFEPSQPQRIITGLWKSVITSVSIDFSNKYHDRLSLTFVIATWCFRWCISGDSCRRSFRSLLLYPLLYMWHLSSAVNSLCWCFGDQVFSLGIRIEKIVSSMLMGTHLGVGHVYCLCLCCLQPNFLHIYFFHVYAVHLYGKITVPSGWVVCH